MDTLSSFVDRQILKSYTNLLSISNPKLIVPRNLLSQPIVLADRRCGVERTHRILTPEKGTGLKPNRTRARTAARTAGRSSNGKQRAGVQRLDGEVARTGNSPRKLITIGQNSEPYYFLKLPLLTGALTHNLKFFLISPID